LKTVAVIPALNEAKHIGTVVTEAKKHVDVVIVSDGRSTDKTRDISHNAGAVIIGTPREGKVGYGICIRRGLQYATKRYKPEAIVILDGDGQHNPAEIPNLLQFILDDSVDVVMGCRGDGMPAYRRFGNRVLTAVCNIGSHFKPHDALTGYWAIRTEHLPKLTENKWGLAVELLIKSRSSGSHMTSVMVQSIYHDNYKDNSHTTPIKLGLALLWLIVKWRFLCEVLKRR